MRRDDIDMMFKGGSDDIKRHKWFRGVDWIGLLEKTVRVSLYHILGKTVM